jgi:hypothetical protein
MNRDKKIVMVKLIIQKKTGTAIVKSSVLISLASIPGIGAWYSVLCGEGCCPSCQTDCCGDGWRVFFFSFSYSPWSYG